MQLIGSYLSQLINANILQDFAWSVYTLKPELVTARDEAIARGYVIHSLQMRIEDKQLLNVFVAHDGNDAALTFFVIGWRTGGMGTDMLGHAYLTSSEFEKVAERSIAYQARIRVVRPDYGMIVLVCVLIAAVIMFISSVRISFY